MNRDNKVKSVRMTLGQFNEHTDARERARSVWARTPTRNRTTHRQEEDRSARSTGAWKGSKLSDRVKSRRDGRAPQDRQGRGSERLTAARVVGSKPDVEKLVMNIKSFPLLGGYEALDSPVYGAWTHGVQPIIDAKDLPDPQMLLALKQRTVIEESRRVRGHRPRRYSYHEDDRYNEYCDREDDVVEPQEKVAHVRVNDPLAPVNANDYSDEENWDEL